MWIRVFISLLKTTSDFTLNRRTNKRSVLKTAVRLVSAHPTPRARDSRALRGGWFFFSLKISSPTPSSTFSGPFYSGEKKTAKEYCVRITRARAARLLVFNQTVCLWRPSKSTRRCIYLLIYLLLLLFFFFFIFFFGLTITRQSYDALPT